MNDETSETESWRNCGRDVADTIYERQIEAITREIEPPIPLKNVQTPTPSEILRTLESEPLLTGFEPYNATKRWDKDDEAERLRNLEEKTA